MAIFIYTLQISKLKLKGLAQSHTGDSGPGSRLNHNSDFRTDYSTSRAQEKADPREGAQGSETGELQGKPGIAN